MIFSVMFDCNSHHNGSFNGLVSKVEVINPDGVEPLISLDGPIDFDGEDLDGTTRFRYEAGRLWLDDREFRYRSHGTWVGNWCYDSFSMKAKDVVALLNHLMSEGWDVMEAETSLFDKWLAKAALTAEDLMEVAG